MTRPNQQLRYWLYLLFAISGFSGLIYESIWSHYLKLFLGHAAYAQTLVLAIFMGGMAIGAWIPSRYGIRWKNLLLRYAAVEGLIGVCAIVFHKIFVVSTDMAYDAVIPALASPLAVNLFKWSLAALLLLPQSILLGMTFPLMSASVIRRYSDTPGKTLAMLYFTNSLGAAIGVLISGFVLIEAVGLPGTVLTAGLINIVVAIVAWAISKSFHEDANARSEKKSARGDGAVSWRLFIAASFLTGTASFIYEIGWIRMLNLVLGTSTHAFELMLSAFIAGLAFGGLWIRRRIDTLTKPRQFLGWVQVAMGLLALGTVVAYNTAFDAMQFLMHSVAATNGGYYMFNIASQGIAILIMMPVTFCAGMTLPLITHTLLRGGHGEQSIGAVYAANTLGAIIGVFLAVHIGLPMLGLKGLVASGAALDMALGVVLLVPMIKRESKQPVFAAAIMAVVSLIAVLVGVEFDRYKMASGVYRHGQFYARDKTEILYHKDGKTATVDLIKGSDGGLTIATNGKSDAKINVAENGLASGDESTMTMAGALPTLLHPQARTAAVIGMGSGLTTHVLLSNPNLERVDTVEIEPAMIDAAKSFRPRVERSFSDPRSRFHIDDAKTFFSASQRHYDIIVSEPSNPWVSGVSGLFTSEFYRRIQSHLNSNGIFIQWVHVYEMDFELVASIVKALGRNFPDFDLYASNDGDLLFVAVREGKTPRLFLENFEKSNLKTAFQRIDIQTFKDLTSRYIGNRTLLEPLFAYAAMPMNSDYFPVLDLHAVRARFLKSDAEEVNMLRAEELPAMEMLGGEVHKPERLLPTRSRYFLWSQRAYIAAAIRGFFSTGRLEPADAFEPSILRHVIIAARPAKSCSDPVMPGLWLDSAHEILKFVTPHSSPAESDAFLRRLSKSDCYRRLDAIQKDIFELYSAAGRRNATQMAALAEKLLKNDKAPRDQDRYFLSAGMLGYLANNQVLNAQQLWRTYGARTLGGQTPDIMLRFLWSHSIYRDRNQNRTNS